MDDQTLIRSWFIWKHACAYLDHDSALMDTAPVKFPRGYSHIIGLLKKAAEGMTYTAFRDLKRRDIRVLGEHLDRGEYFLMFSYRGETKLLRIHQEKLRSDVQSQVNDLVKRIWEGKFIDAV